MKNKRYNHRRDRRLTNAAAQPAKREPVRLNIAMEGRQGAGPGGSSGFAAPEPGLGGGCVAGLLTLLFIGTILGGYRMVNGFRGLRSEPELSVHEGLRIPLSMQDLAEAFPQPGRLSAFQGLMQDVCPYRPQTMSPVDDLPAGKVSEHLPLEFYVGQELDAWVKLEVDTMEVEKTLSSHPEGFITPRFRFGGQNFFVPLPQVQTTVKIRVAPRMKAALVGSDGVFQIKELQDATQMTSATEPTEWGWKVKALAPGEHTLDLTVSVVMGLDGTDSFRRVRHVPVKVMVTASRYWTVRKFWMENWQYLLTTILLPLAVWGFTLWRKSVKKGPRKRHADDDALLVPVTQFQLDQKIIPSLTLHGQFLNYAHACRIKTVAFYVVAPASEVSHSAAVGSTRVADDGRSISFTFLSITKLADPLSLRETRRAPKSARYFRSKRLLHSACIEDLFEL